MLYSPIFCSVIEALGNKAGKRYLGSDIGTQEGRCRFYIHSLALVCVPQKYHQINRPAPPKRRRSYKYLQTRISNLIRGYEIEGLQAFVSEALCTLVNETLYMNTAKTGSAPEFTTFYLLPPVSRLQVLLSRVDSMNWHVLL